MKAKTGRGGRRHRRVLARAKHNGLMRLFRGWEAYFVIKRSIRADQPRIAVQL